MARGDVEESEFVRSCLIIGNRRRDWIAGISQINEIDAFDDAAVFDVKTGNDACLEHLRSRGRRPRVAQERERGRPIEPPIVKSPTGDCAFELLRARLEQRAYIGQRSETARSN